MASTDYLPTREAELVTWSNNFSSIISSDPAAVGLDIAQAGAFATLNTAWVDAYTAANSGASDTSASIVTKRDAKKAMVEDARALVRIIQADPDVTNTQRTQLGITVPDPEPSPAPEPSAPELSIEWQKGRTLRLRLENPEAPDSRGKPDGVMSATILTYVGDTAPISTLDWAFFTNTSRPIFDFNIPASVAGGERVWISAFWTNTRGVSGPPAPAVSARASDDLAQAA